MFQAGSSWSCSSFLFKMLMAGSVGTDLNSAETSNEVTHSPPWSWIHDLIFKSLGVTEVKW